MATLTALPVPGPKWVVECPNCHHVAPWEHVHLRVEVKCGKCGCEFVVKPVL